MLAKAQVKTEEKREAGGRGRRWRRGGTVVVARGRGETVRTASERIAAMYDGKETRAATEGGDEDTVYA